MEQLAVADQRTRVSTSSRDVVVCFWTGGTIASTRQAGAGGALPTVSPTELVSTVVNRRVRVELVELDRLASAHFTPAQVFGWRRTIEDALAREEVRGAVLVQGTDTLEECAYLHDLVIESEKPLVYTGAMRLADDGAPDGPRNLEAAFAVAADQTARGLGVLVVMNDEIHAARDVLKLHTSSVSAFSSPGWGPLGVVERWTGGVQVRIARRPALRESLRPSYIEERVAYAKAVLGAGSVGILTALNAGARGLVMECFGVGDAALGMRGALDEAFAREVPVVVASRAIAGAVGPKYGEIAESAWLWERGAWFADGVSAPKARIKLMLALGFDDPAVLERCFVSRRSSADSTT